MKSLLTILLLISLAAPAGAANPWKGNWIWNDTPRRHNYFRKIITAADRPVQAKIAVTVDNVFELYVNGTRVGGDSDWMTLEVYDVTGYVRKGRNIIAVKGTDPGPDIGALLLEGAFTYPSGRVTVFGSDGTWRMSGVETPGWISLDFDDSSWQTPKVIGKPPAGPWGGIDHPTLAPGTPLDLVSIDCPKRVMQGQTFAVTATVRPVVEIPFDSPVAIQALIDGEPAYEQWMDPDVPTTRWKTGETKTVRFPDFRLPIYIPSGKLQLRLITNATKTSGMVDIKVGNKAKAPQPAEAIVKRLSVTPVRNGSELEILTDVDGLPKGGSLLFTLWKGREMWFAANVSGSGRVRLPEGLPGGSYTARLMPHKTRCPKSAVAIVTLPGPRETTLRPLGYGTFVDRNKIPHRWYINAHGAMIWDGRSYIPIGAMFLSRFFHDFKLGAVQDNEKRFREDIRLLTTLKKAGITDVYLNPCHRWQDEPLWVWQRWTDICEEIGINYGIQITNQVKPLRAFKIAQDEYLVPIKGGGTATAFVPGEGGTGPRSDSIVYYAAFDSRTGELLDTGRAAVEPVEKGVEVEAAPEIEAGREINVHFIPEFEYGDGMHDYWSSIGLYKEWAGPFFGKLKLGPHFRLWIDPLDNEQGFGGRPLLPHSPAFRSMFARFLKETYKTTSDLAKAWAVVGADNLDCAGFSRFVPFGKPEKTSDVGYVMDDGTGRSYKVDLSKSRMWYDMLRFRDSSVARFNSLASDIIKSYQNAPVVLKGTACDCFTNLRTYGGFDGVGMEAYGAAPELVRGCGGGVYSRCKQANRTMWTLTTETGLADEYCGYPDPIRLTKELGSMLEMNGKGTFYFVLGAPSDSGWSIFNLFDDPRQLYWMGAYARLARSSKKLPDYEPAVDYYFPGRIEGQDKGFAPSDVGFHSDNPSQSIPGESGRWVVSASTQIPADAKRVIVSLENEPATGIYGQTFEKLLKTREVVMVGHRKNLGALSVDRYYTDRCVEDSDGIVIQALSPTPTSKVFARTAGGTVYGLTDGNLTIYSKANWMGAVKKMAGKPQDIDFYSDVLGLDILDLGPAFQGMHFGSTTYIWNMLEPENELTLEVPQGTDDVSIHPADTVSRPVSGPISASFTLPADARTPTVIENVENPKITGVDSANLFAASCRWAMAKEEADKLNMTAETPHLHDWHELYAAADQLLTLVREADRTTTAARMYSVSVDGDLSEWRDEKPIFMSLQVLQDYAIPKEYSDAKFYTGCDDDYIYVAGDVNDEVIANNYTKDSLWNGDAIEVFIDLHPEVDPQKTDYNSDSFQFIFAPTSRDGTPAMAVKNPKLPPDSMPQHSLWAVKRREGGWQFEAAISRLDINNYGIGPGGKIGFTVQLDDSDGGDRTSCQLWRGRQDTSRNRTAFGRMVFGG